MYQIADEPIPSESLKQIVFRPSAPLLAAMMCGAWLAWPWFAVNSFAIGSPTKKKELLLCVAGAAGSFGLAIAVFALVRWGVIESRLTYELALLSITMWKLGIAQAIANLQSKSFEVYTYNGGGAKNPRLVIVAGVYLRSIVMRFVDHPLWVIIVSGGL